MGEPSSFGKEERLKEGKKEKEKGRKRKGGRKEERGKEVNKKKRKGRKVKGRKRKVKE